MHFETIQMWTWGDWTIEFAAGEEDVPVADCFDDPEAIAWVLREYDAGNPAAWFCARVTATIGGFSGTDYLGACAYESFEDFTRGDCYFGDMVREAMCAAIQEVDAAVYAADRAREILAVYA